MATYALINPINSVETIENVIVASPETAATYLAPEGDYDYVINISELDPTPGIGWSYDPGMDSFSPPPEDFEGELEAALYAVDAAIEAAVLAYLACDSGQRSSAVGSVLSNLSLSESEEEQLLMSAVTDFLALAAGE